MHGHTTLLVLRSKMLYLECDLTDPKNNESRQPLFRFVVLGLVKSHSKLKYFGTEAGDALDRSITYSLFLLPKSASDEAAFV